MRTQVSRSFWAILAKAALLPLAHQYGAGARRQRRQVLPRRFLRALLYHDERLLLGPGPALLHDGNGDRPNSILGRLPVRRQPTRNPMDGNLAAMRRR